jgi:hypothetical protein
MVTTEVIIAAMNAFNDAEEALQVEDSVEQVGAVTEGAEVAQPETDATPSGPETEEVVEGLAMGADDCPELVPQEEDDSDDEAEEEEEENEDEESSKAKSQPEVRRSERIKGGVSKPSRFVATTVKLKNTAQEHDDEIQAAKAAEIKQVFEELNALEPVEKTDIPLGIKPLGCHLFTVQKFDASGEHDKYKSRLVSHGNEQDTSMYPDRSSPTVSVHAIMTCLALAACNPTYTLAKIDVKGTFIQTEMKGTPVYIRCTGGLKAQILQMYPEYSKYVGSDGVLYCKLKKALYGCVQASKLWYEKLKVFLAGQGYVHGDVDPCVFRRVVGGKVYLLLVCVDDILLIGDER